MPGFLGIWLPICVCTWCALLYQFLGGLDYASPPTVAIIIVELAALLAWALYWIVLYPNYFTPFRHLPTPPVCFAL